MVQYLKEALRRQMLAKRDSVPKAELETMSEAMRERLFSRPRFIESRVVAFYLPKGSEAGTSGMIRLALKLGKEVVVPVTGEDISFVRFTSFDDLAPGRFGIPEPRTRNPKPPREPDLVVVPGIAFGLCMHRLGYGKGYYDRYLAKSFAYRIGICYDFQVVERLPKHEDDQRMDEIITEKRVIH